MRTYTYRFLRRNRYVYVRFFFSQIYLDYFLIRAELHFGGGRAGRLPGALWVPAPHPTLTSRGALTLSAWEVRPDPKIETWI